MTGGQGLTPAQGSGSPQTIKRAARLSVCECGQRIEYRWTDPARTPEILDGHRGGFRAAIPCPCGRVNIRHSSDLVRYARTIGQFDAPEIVIGLSTVRRVLLNRLADGSRRPDPDKRPEKVERIKDLDLAVLARAVKSVSELEARLGGYLVERIEITQGNEESDYDPALEEMRRQIVRDAASKMGVTVIDADFEVRPVAPAQGGDDGSPAP